MEDSFMDKVSNSLGQFLPDQLQFLTPFIVAAITVLVGWVIANIARGLVSGGINKTGIGKKARSTGGNIGKSVGKAVFWVIMLIVILMALGQFPQLKEPLEPLTGMMDNILGYGDNLLGAILLLVIGGVVAKVGKEATQSSLEAAQVDTLVAKAGLTEETSGASLPKALGGLIAGLILLFFGVAAVEALGIETISAPVSSMLDTVLNYLPKIIIAGVILGIAVYIGKFVSNLAKNTLPALGIDNSLSSIADLDGSGSPSFVPSQLIGTIAFAGMVLIGLTAAMSALGVPELTNIFNSLLEIGGRVALGAVIIGAGLFIANFISGIVTQTSGDLAGRVIKYVTIILVAFMGLSQMGLGQEIVDTAFKYSLGAAAFAAGVGGALAFGLGGREWAAKKLKEWMS